MMETLKKLSCGPLGFDFTRLFEEALGENNGLRLSDLQSYEDKVSLAREALRDIRGGKVHAHGEPSLFLSLPYENKNSSRVEEFAISCRGKYEAVVSIGIGGSYLGNRLIQEALGHSEHNLMAKKNPSGPPKIFFAGQNVDATALGELFEVLDLEKTLFVIISKSGGTMEPLAALMVILEKLGRKGLKAKDHIVTVTDPHKGYLKSWADSEKITCFEIPPGVGGRFTVLSQSGLLTAALAGIDTATLLEGARDYDQMAQASLQPLGDPALAYAYYHHILHIKFGKNLGVLMPYAMSLRALGEWYVQLLAESLGKNQTRESAPRDGMSRTPIAALGTTDMHAQTQQHMEGDNNRVLTFVEAKPKDSMDITLSNPFDGPNPAAALHGKQMSRLLGAALLANEEALADAGRPSCRISIPKVDAKSLGALILFFETSVAYEGEFLNVNAFDQPGVEAYKSKMKTLLADVAPGF